MNTLCTMNKLLQAFKLYVILLILPISYATEGIHGVNEQNKHVHGAHEECPLPKSRMDIINCALEFHPSIKRGKLRVNSAIKLKNKADQIPNPVLSTRFVKGKNIQDTSEFETNLSFTIELGGKRDSRKNFALAKEEQEKTSNETIKAHIKIATILNLFRLRQLQEEKRVLKESLLAFSEVIKQLKNLPRLSAEQEASLTLFEIAYEESKIDESEIFEEERKLEHFFHVSTGHSLEEIQAYLPPPPKKWKSLVTKNVEKSSPEVKQLTSLAMLAQKRLDIENSEAWPDLKLGPSFSIEKEGQQENKMLGLNLQIALPLFQTNDGAKAYARSELVRAQKNISLTKSEENHERFEQLRIYQSAINILNKTMKSNYVKKRHKRIEKLYLRGVISSSIFLDSLKQQLSYLKRRNNREITALTALWNIYKYDGKIFKENL